MKSVKKNFAYNIIYQILILIIPLVTAPYLARTIGVKGVGIYSYKYSIVYYFMLFTLLGVNNYGSKTIAKVRDNQKELSRIFFEIYTMQLLLGIILLISYYIILIFNNKYKIIAAIDGLFVVSAILDINWLFFGLEDFKKTITRNSIIKILCVIFIFLFVKSSEDLWKYTLIMASTTCLSQVVLWLFASKYIKFTKIKFNDIIKHIKPNLLLFVPVIAVSLYKMMDKVMLGSIASVTEVGYYENAEKIINIPQSFIIALGTVMLPRLSSTLAKGDTETAKKYIESSMLFAMFLSFATFFGLLAIGYDFAIFFYGKSFFKTGILIMILSPILPFLAFANVLRTQYLIPKDKNKIYIASVFLGAITNIIINSILIPIFGSIGAAIGTVFAEISVMMYQTVKLRKYLPVWKYIKSGIVFFMKALIMFIAVYPFNYLHISSLIRLIIQIGVGCFVYGLLNIKYILSIININKILIKLKLKKI